MKHLLLCVLATGLAFTNISEAEASTQNTWNTSTYTAGDETFEVKLPGEGMVLSLPEATIVSSISENNVFLVVTVPTPSEEYDEDEIDEEDDDLSFVEQDDLDDNFEEMCSVLKANGILIIDYQRSEDGIISIIAKGQDNNDFGWDGYLHIRLHITKNNVYALISVEEGLEASEKTLCFFDSFQIVQ